MPYFVQIVSLQKGQAHTYWPGLKKSRPNDLDLKPVTVHQLVGVDGIPITGHACASIQLSVGDLSSHHSRILVFHISDPKIFVAISCSYPHDHMMMTVSSPAQLFHCSKQLVAVAQLKQAQISQSHDHYRENLGYSERKAEPNSESLKYVVWEHSPRSYRLLGFLNYQNLRFRALLINSIIKCMYK